MVLKKKPQDPSKPQIETKPVQKETKDKVALKVTTAKEKQPPPELNAHQRQMWILANKSHEKYDREIALKLPLYSFIRNLIDVGAVPLKEIVDFIPFYGFKNILFNPKVQSTFKFLITDSRPQTFTFVPVKGHNEFIQQPKQLRRFFLFVRDHCKKDLKLESFGSHVWNMDFIALLVIKFLESINTKEPLKSAGPVSVPVETSLKITSKNLIAEQAELMSGDMNPLFKPHLEVIQNACQGNARMEQTVKCLRYLSVPKCGVVHGALIRGILEFACAEYASKFPHSLPKDFNWTPLAKKIQLIAHVLIAESPDADGEESLRHAINSSNFAVNLLNDFVHKDTLPVTKDLIYPLDFAASFVSVVWPSISK